VEACKMAVDQEEARRVRKRIDERVVGLEVVRIRRMRHYDSAVVLVVAGIFHQSRCDVAHVVGLCNMDCWDEVVTVVGDDSQKPSSPPRF
jgi:hypothetical protein